MSSWLSLETIFQRLDNKINYISELSIIKRVIKPFAKNFKTTDIKFINENFANKINFFDGKTIHNVDCLTSKIIYSVFLNKKAEQHYSQLSWENTLNITPGKRGWAEIYKRRLKTLFISSSVNLILKF